MTETILTYNINTTFGGIENLNQGQLHQEIEDQIAKFYSTQKIGTNLRLYFSDTLTSGEQTTLDGILSAHTPSTTPVKNNYFNYYLNQTKQVIGSYQKFAAFKFEGTSSEAIQGVSAIEVLSSTEGSDYDVRIVDVTNNNVICEITGLSGNDDLDVINDMGTLSNMPSNEAVFEVQVRKNGGGKNTNVTISQLTIYIDAA